MILNVQTNVYIDGFNLYYGCLKNSSCKWLDLYKLCSTLRFEENIKHIYYFTALVTGPTQPNQKIYWKALQTNPLISIIEGKFKNKKAYCPLCKRPFPTTEEKRSDVNIALQMVDDAFNSRCDRFVLISGDSDLVPAIKLVRKICPQKKIVVYVPNASGKRTSTEIRQAATWSRDLTKEVLKKAQFPFQLQSNSGEIITKPSTW